jgi:hypothetical protein
MPVPAITRCSYSTSSVIWNAVRYVPATCTVPMAGMVCSSRLLRATRARSHASISGRITQGDYDKKARELKERQAEIALRIEQHQQGDAEYRTTLESLISLASRAAELFERSKTEQKRQLLAFVFSNLRLRGKKLEISLRSPFDLMVDRRTYSSWLAFLNTVRTERFDDILAFGPIPSLAAEP